MANWRLHKRSKDKAASGSKTIIQVILCVELFRAWKTEPVQSSKDTLMKRKTEGAVNQLCHSFSDVAPFIDGLEKEGRIMVFEVNEAYSFTGQG